METVNPQVEPDADFLYGAERSPESEETFSPEIYQDVLGLAFLGALTKQFDFLGHSFVMRTLKAGEELAVGQLMKEYMETLGRDKAWATAIVAASLETVDGRPLIAALGPDTLASVRERFEYVRDKWYWPTIEGLYVEYSDLTLRQANAYDELASKSQASRGPS